MYDKSTSVFNDVYVSDDPELYIWGFLSILTCLNNFTYSDF